MMTIQVLGSGCPTCVKFHEAVKQTVKQMGWHDRVDYLTGPVGMQKIIELGVMSTPVLTIDGQVAMTGFASDTDEIKTAILKIKTSK